MQNLNSDLSSQSGFLPLRHSHPNRVAVMTAIHLDRKNFRAEVVSECSGCVLAEGVSEGGFQGLELPGGVGQDDF